MQTNIVALIAFSLISAGAHAESMRCGSSIVDETASVATLLEKCGEPQTRDVRTEDVYAPNVQGVGTRKIGTRTIERWIYQRSSNSLPMAVTIVDGKVTRLERVS